MKSVALGLIRFYQACLSPALPSSCRYYPTCSAYAYEAIEQWGVQRGVGMALRRLLRCRPFAGRGYDPVPLEEIEAAQNRSLFSRLVTDRDRQEFVAKHRNFVAEVETGG